MLLRQTSYFDRFQCIASACPDSCCQEWDVQVDSDTAAYYRTLSGPLGDRLRQVLREEDGETVMTIENRRCPMWRQDGLCRIQAELGHGALCQVCQTFPRLRHDYGDFMEQDLELSCPEAARLILSAPPAPLVEKEVPGGEEPEYDPEIMDILLRSRATALEILSDPDLSVGETLVQLLLYGYQVQDALDGGPLLPIDPAAALETARSMAVSGSSEDLIGFFRELEILTDSWKAMLDAPAPGPWHPMTFPLARYLVRRYWLQAVSDFDLYCRAKFIAVACLLIRELGGDFPQTAQRFSKEIENDPDNVEALLDAAYAHPAFTDDRLLGLLLAK